MDTVSTKILLLAILGLLNIALYTSSGDKNKIHLTFGILCFCIVFYKLFKLYLVAQGA